MEVVLLERIRHLGQMGDVVEVKKGYARNFLLPQGKALRSTPENRERFERERATIEARDLELRTEAEHAAEKFSGLQIDVIRQASEAGTLYGSVSSRDIADACKEQSINIERRQIELERPIKTLGMHAVQVVLHPEVAVPMVVCVARSEEEAQLQARGIAPAGTAAEAEQQLDAELTVAAEQQAPAAAEVTGDQDGGESKTPDSPVPEAAAPESATAESVTAAPTAPDSAAAVPAAPDSPTSASTAVNSASAESTSTETKTPESMPAETAAAESTAAVPATPESTASESVATDAPAASPPPAPADASSPEDDRKA